MFLSSAATVISQFRSRYMQNLFCSLYGTLSLLFWVSFLTLSGRSACGETPTKEVELVPRSHDVQAVTVDDPSDTDRLHGRPANPLKILQTAEYSHFQPTNGIWVDLPGLDGRVNGTGWDLWSEGKELMRNEMRLLSVDGSGYSNQVDSPLWSSRVLPVKQSITGYLKGSWRRAGNENSIGFSETPERSGSSQSQPLGDLGDIRVWLLQDGGSPSSLGGGSAAPSGAAITGITAEFHLSVPTQPDGFFSLIDSWRIHASGVYFPERGSAILTTTTPDSRGGQTFGPSTWPFLALSEDLFDDVRQYVNLTQSSADPDLEPTESREDSLEKCDYIIYLQVHSPNQPVGISDVQTDQSSQAGVSNPAHSGGYNLSPTQISMVMVSPPCGHLISSLLPQSEANSSGPLWGLQTSQVQALYRHHVLTAIMLFSLQVYALLRQLGATSLSRFGRTSWTAITMVTTHHTCYGILFAFAGLSSPATWHVSAVAVFLAWTVFFNLDLPYISRVAETSALHRARARQNFVGSAATVEDDGNSTGPDVYSINQPMAGTLPIFTPSDQAGLVGSVSNGPSLISSRGHSSYAPALGAYIQTVWPTIALFCAGFFLCPLGLRPLFNLLFTGLFTSAWSFQIVANVQSPSAEPVWEFKVALILSLTWFLEIAYFYRVWDGSISSFLSFLPVPRPSNLVDLMWLPSRSPGRFNISPETSFLLLTVWIVAQVVVLGMQQVLGPRFVFYCIPFRLGKNRTLPAVHDWCPLFYQDQAGKGGNLPSGGFDTAEDPEPSKEHIDQTRRSVVTPPSSRPVSSEVPQAGRTRRFDSLTVHPHFSTPFFPQPTVHSHGGAEGVEQSYQSISLVANEEKEYSCCICRASITIPVAILSSCPPSTSFLPLSQLHLLGCSTDENAFSAANTSLSLPPIPPIFSIMKRSLIHFLIRILRGVAPPLPSSPFLFLVQAPVIVVFHLLPTRLSNLLYRSLWRFRLWALSKQGVSTYSTIKSASKHRDLSVVIQHWCRILVLRFLLRVRSLLRSFDRLPWPLQFLGSDVLFARLIDELYTFIRLSSLVSHYSLRRSSTDVISTSSSDAGSSRSSEPGFDFGLNTSLPGTSAATLPDSMLTPCRHIYHPDCLLSWMAIKMECPLCRRGLPSL